MQSLSVNGLAVKSFRLVLLQDHIIIKKWINKQKSNLMLHHGVSTLKSKLQIFFVMDLYNTTLPMVQRKSGKMVEKLLKKRLKCNEMGKEVIKLFNLLGAALFLMTLQILVSCTSEEEATVEKEIILNGEKLNIRISEEAYMADVPVRSAVLEKDTVVDLGNGIIAEMAMVSDQTTPTAPVATTRATSMSDGHYTIYILDASGNRLTGNDKDLSGTLTGGNFVPDYHANIKLPSGTYTFVCHNDAVEAQGNALKITNSSITSVCPMIGAVTKTISTGMNEVSFTMKHYAARVRTELTTYTAYAEMDNNNTTFSSVSNGLTELSLSLKGDAPSRAASGSMMYTESSAKQFENVGTQVFSSVKKPFKTNGNYVYIPLAPGETIAVGDLKYHFNGKIYGKVANAVFPNKEEMQANHSYLITLKFASKTPLLLFQDGTVGYKGNESAGRVPVGVVTKEKTVETDTGTAMALNNAGDARFYIPIAGNYLLPYSDENVGKLFDIEADGLHYTYEYETGTSFQDYLSGPGRQFPPAAPVSDFQLNGDYLYPAFHMAAHYAPSVPTQNLGKWFLPTGSQWRDALMLILKLPKSDFEGVNSDGFMTEHMQFSSDPDADFDAYGEKVTVPLSLPTLQALFTAVGGTFPDGLYNVAGGFTLAGNRVHYIVAQPTRIVTTWTQMADFYPAHVRPFVHF